MNFIEQHPNYKSYKHDDYYLSALPYSFNRELNNLIHSLLMKLEDDEITLTAWSLQNQLAALVKHSPCERGPYNFLIEEISQVVRTITRKGFPYTMDAIGILLSITTEDEINAFLSEHELGYSCYSNHTRVDWFYNEGVIDLSKVTPSILDTLINRGKPRSGFFATVTQYEDNKNGEKYALKRLKSEYNENESYRRRFKREIKIMERLKELEHQNVVPLIDSRYNEDSNEYWYLMPYAATNLHDFIKKYNSGLNIESKLSFFSQILDAIEFAHSYNILHRDLSPFNVLLNGREQVWVSDFGLGKDYSNLSHQGYSAAPGYGSILYAAPEQQENLADATKKSDVYSLGKLLYFILTGRDPRTTADSPQYSSVINKATLDDPAGRFEDAHEFKSEFLKYKSLYEQANVSPINTVSDLVLQKTNFEWMEFHETVLRAESYNHIYYDFLDPISNVLDDTNKIESYILVIGNDIEKFIEIYVGKLQECYGTVGWPFTSVNSFGYFLRRLYESTTDYPRCRFILLKELWYIATELDKWAVQDIIVKLIDFNRIPESIQLDFSVFMMESGKYFEKLNSINLTNKPVSLKNAILHLRRLG